LKHKNCRIYTNVLDLGCCFFGTRDTSGQADCQRSSLVLKRILPVRLLEPSRLVPTLSFSQSLPMSQYAATTSALLQPRRRPAPKYSPAEIGPAPKCGPAEQRPATGALWQDKIMAHLMVFAKTNNKGKVLDASVKNDK